MKPITDDPLLQSLAELPAIPEDAAAADAIRRLARAELMKEESASPFFERLTAAWSNVVLPTVLLTAGAAYAWSALVMMGRIYASG